MGFGNALSDAREAPGESRAGARELRGRHQRLGVWAPHPLPGVIDWGGLPVGMGGVSGGGWTRKTEEGGAGREGIIN